MTEPEQALEQARAAAASMRARGAYGEPPERVETAPAGSDTTERLLQWALIEPDVGEVRSTRRWGAPVTALKRGLLRLLLQYHSSLIAEQTRFNVNLLVHVRRLEERIEALERDAAGGPDPGP
jgi:hypothetical protein